VAESPAGHEECAPPRGAGSAFVPERPLGGAAHPAQMPTGLPRAGLYGLLFRLRGRPPACHRRGRSPSNQPTRDRADGATLGRWDAKASQRPRRPEIRAASRTATAAAAGFNVRGSVKGRDRSRPRHAENHAPSGCRVRICAGSTSRPSGPPRTNADRAPPESATRSAVPAERQAAGAPPAWSQPSQSTHERPRRWCDAGLLGRHSVTAAQKAGLERTLRWCDDATIHRVS